MSTGHGPINVIRTPRAYVLRAAFRRCIRASVSNSIYGRPWTFQKAKCPLSRLRTRGNDEYSYNTTHV